MAIITVLSEILCEVDMEIFKSYEIWMIVGAALLIILYYYHREKKKVHNAKEKELLKKGDMHECFWEVLSGGYFPVLFFFMSLGNITGLAYLFPVAIAVVLVIAIVMQVKIYVCKEELVSRSGWSYEEAVLEKKKNILESSYNIVYAVIVPITILFISYGTCSSYYSVPKSFCILLFAIIVITVAAIMQCKRFNYKKKMRKYQMAKKEGLCMEELQIDKKSSLRELVYYCTEPEPVGALMFTGEWGCGKTYLIDHELKATFDGQNGREEKVIIRVSLFGVSSVENIHSLVKESWMEAYYENFPTVLKKTTRFLKNIQSSIAKMEGNDEMKLLASVGLSNFMRVKNIINKKPVILVFDDLERCQMDRIDVLGCINDYCENQKFYTIIVCNPDKMQSDKERNEEDKAKDELIQLTYAEIKEKIVQRTVQYKPDYEGIVHNVIRELKYQDKEYQGFIEKHERELLELFAPNMGVRSTGENVQLHNIRSLKCAITDFYRIYIILEKNGFSDVERWLYAFTRYVIAYKAGVKADFNRNYMLKAIEEWLLHGNWDEEQLQYEIKERIEREKAKKPTDLLRVNRIMDLDEEDVNNGFPELIELAYSGKLTLDEYVNLIQNSVWARQYKFKFPNKIEWGKIREGIAGRINQLKEEQPEGQQIYTCISKENESLFDKEEWKTYLLIDEFREGNTLLFCRNRKIYIDGMGKDPLETLYICQNNRFNAFDDEMASATVKAFERCNNAEKCRFPGYFERIWENWHVIAEIDKKNTQQGFQILLKKLEELKNELLESNKVFSIAHTEVFIQNVQKLLEKNSL